MPRENSLRDQFRVIVRQQFKGTVTNHEDKFQKGIADTSFAFRQEKLVRGAAVLRVRSGWIEFKNHHTWPKLWSTELRIDLSAEQRIWLRERWLHANDCWIIVRICDTIFMFTGAHTDELYFPISQERFEALWIGKWEKTINPQELRELICETLDHR